MVSVLPEPLAALRRAGARLRHAPTRPTTGCTSLASVHGVRKGYDLEDEAREAIALVADHTQLSYERLVTLYEQVAYVERRGLPGALVECGVWRGGAAAMMAIANLARGRERRQLHLFDSFEGMPAPRADVDGEAALVLMAANRSSGVNVAAQEEALDLIVGRSGYPAPSVFVHKGWFDETLPAARSSLGPIAVLRVDGDWYASTRTVFEHLYDLVTPGGVVVIDDYGHFEGCRRATDEFLLTRAPHAYLHYIDYTGRYLIKP
jgi:hypothetical protein